ncbi:MAG: PaaI family thioesterase [Gordonia sp. (in: high G+C Gram-positive bacteria)]|uniref:PaaI family thioesterase n=1 Tax=Gordonia sp. (in: high G+C Gram-positive bacteria) TaxID=84139 RepID=UPI0039E670FD
MTEQKDGAPPRQDGAGGFPARMDLTTERGGPRYPELIEQMRTLMDNVRYACPDESAADDVIALLTAANARLAPTLVDEWTSPSGTRVDLPSRGDIGLPPYKIFELGPDGIAAKVTFRRFHIGGNDVAHGGYLALLFDDMAGITAGVHAGRVCRTAYLTVNYRSLTPLETPLVVRCRVDRREDRKLFVTGTLQDGDRVCADAEGLFIMLRPGQA